MARHSPPGDRSFVLSVARHLAGAVALVIGVAAAFWGIGQVRLQEPPGDGPVIGTAAPPETPGPTTTLTAPPATVPSPTAPVSPEPAGTQPPASPSLEPSSITLQVLDAVLDDDGRATSDLVRRLREAGYNVVAQHTAVRQYEVTTVFHTPGFEQAARQVAATFGFQRVEVKPDNLSDTVQVHVIVGADYTPSGG